MAHADQSKPKDSNPDAVEEIRPEEGSVAVMDEPGERDGAPAAVLQSDDPIEEPLAEVLSADPEAKLAAGGNPTAAVEALLFANPDPLSVKRLVKALGNIEINRVRDALTELRADYERRGAGIRLVEVAGGFQLATREEFAEFIGRLETRKKPPTLSNATLETLAIVAYRQPITRAAIESIRGVESSGTIRNLIDLELIVITGRKEVVGRPALYGTTEKFLKTFGLKRLKDMPNIKELRERFVAAEAESKQDRPAAETDEPAGDSTDQQAAQEAEDGVEDIESDDIDEEIEDEIEDEDDFDPSEDDEE